MDIALLIYIVVFMAFLYFTCNRYEYIPNVIIYVIGMGLIPTLFSFNGLGNLVIILLFRFVVGLLFIKVLTMLNDYLQNGAYFFIAAIVLEGFISKFVLAFIIALLA